MEQSALEHVTFAKLPNGASKNALSLGVGTALVAVSGRTPRCLLRVLQTDWALSGDESPTPQ